MREEYIAIEKEKRFAEQNRRGAESFADPSSGIASEAALQHIAKLLANGGRVRNVGFQRIVVDPGPQPEGADQEYMHVVTVVADR